MLSKTFRIFSTECKIILRMFSSVFLVVFLISSVYGQDNSTVLSPELKTKYEEAKKNLEPILKNLKISPEMQKEAERSYEKIKNSPLVEKYRKEIERDLAGRTNRGVQKEKTVKERDRVMLAEDERIYIFMSSSVPEVVWHRYVEDITEAGVGDKVKMVLRGCIGGCRYIKPTLKFLSKVLTEDSRAEVQIDPLLFRKFGIKRVPCIVYEKGVSLYDPSLSEGLKENVKSRGRYWMSCGDWSLGYHMKVLARLSGNRSLERLMEKRYYK